MSHVAASLLRRLMSTQNLAFGGVICALSAICIIFSSLFHLIFPLVIMCIFFGLCLIKCGRMCAVIVIFTSNVIGFLIGGFGGGEILFSLLLFSPFSFIVCLTSSFDKKFWHYLLRALIYALFSFGIYLLFATVLKDLVGMSEREFGLPVYLFGVIWTVAFTVFGFALDKVTALISARFFKKND